MTTDTTIGVILGSTRVKSNTAAVSAFVTDTVARHFPHVQLETIDLVTSPGHPLPCVLEDIVPMGLDPKALPDAHVDIAVRAWSAKVLGWDGVIIVTPQYNWSFPGPLKLALDHLYHEWKGKPVAIITVGGRGGDQAQTALRHVLGGALHMRMVKTAVEIKVPRELMSGGERWRADADALIEHTDEVVRAVSELLELTRGEVVLEKKV